MYIHQIDIKTAFLYSVLDEKIYVKPPKGYEGLPGQDWRFKKVSMG
jgi:hypothetical protein